MNRLKRKSGFTLIEMLVALGILVLLVVAMTNGMNSAMRVYDEATFEADSGTLSDILNNSIGDVLRYSENISRKIPEGEETEVLVFTNYNYGVKDAEFYLEGEYIKLRDGLGTTAEVVNTGAYPKLKVSEFNIDYVAPFYDENNLIIGGGYYKVDYTIDANDRSGLSRDVSIYVRPVNEPETYKEFEEEMPVVVKPVNPDDPSATPESDSEYVITYDGNGGRFVLFGVTYSEPQTVTIASFYLPTIMLRNGYEFTGWYMDKGNGLSVKVSEGYVPSESTVSLKAEWVPHVYTVRFDVDGKIETKTYTLLEDITFDIPTKEGWSFREWKVTESQGNWIKGDLYDGEKIPAGRYGNVTLTAQWDENYRYKLVFNENLGTDTVNKASNMPDSKDTGWLSKTNTKKTFSWTSVPVRLGYDFLGWAESANGPVLSGDVALKEITITGIPAKTATKTLYAKWQLKTYTITYNRSSTDQWNASSDEVKSYSITSDLVLPSLKARTGYHFRGWDVVSTDSNSSWQTGKTYAPGEALAGKYGSITLTPHWDRAMTIKYTANDGSGSTKASLMRSSDNNKNSNTITLLEPTREGYSFDGWYDKASGGNRIGEAGDGYRTYVVPASPSSDTLTVYAHWTPIKYTIKVINGGGTKAGKIELYHSVTGSSAKYDTVRFGSAKNGVTGQTVFTAQFDFDSYIYYYDYTSGSSNMDRAKTTINGSAWAYNTDYYIKGDVEIVFFANSYKVSFNSGGYGSYPDAYDYDGSGVKLPDPSSYRTDYWCGGWWDTVSGRRIGNGNAIFVPDKDYTLEIKWNKKYSIKVYNNYSTTDSTYTELWNSYDSNSVALPDLIGTRTGYSFAGWSKSRTGSVAYSAGKLLDITSNRDNLYAVWTPNSYTVHFNGNGANGGGTADQGFTYDKAQNLTANGFSCTYAVTFNSNGGSAVAQKTAVCSFKGWALSANGRKEYDDRASVKNLATGGTVNLYALWNAGSVALTDPTRAGYTFAGWYTDSALTKSAGTTTYTPTAACTLYAKWTPITYTAKFDSNGGSAAPTDISFNIEGGLTLPAATSVSKKCSDLTGWKVTEPVAGNWTGTAYSPDQKITGKYGDVTFTAQWTPYQYTVSFNGNGANGGSTPNQTFTYGTSQPLTANGFTRKYTVTFSTTGDSVASKTAAYTFAGWAASATGSKKYNDKQTVGDLTETKNGNVQLYALWTSASVTLPDAVKPGYKFDGWYSDSAFKTLVGAKGASYTPKADITLYAKFTSAPYTATFEPDGGSAGKKTVSYKIDQALAVPENAGTKAGYSFYNWKVTTAAGNWTAGNTVSGSSSITGKYGNVTLTAQWTPNPYTVSFNGNGATSGSTASQTFAYGTAQALNANGFARKHTVTFSTSGDSVASQSVTYTFDGWATSQNGAKVYNDKQSVSNLTTAKNGTVTLFAHWVSASIELPNATKAGYTFEGWYSDSSYGTLVGGKDDSYTPSANVTLYAKFTPATYTATFEADGGSAGRQTRDYKIEGLDLSAPAGAGVKTGYSFKNWKVTAAGGNWTAGNTINGSASVGGKYGKVTFTAQWNTVSYTATFVTNNNSSSTSTQNYTIESTLTMPDPGTKTGYDFNGWKVIVNNGAWSTTKLWQKSDTTAVGEYGNVTFKAQWTHHKYTATLHTKSDEADSSKTYYIDTTLSLPNTAGTRTGYVFAGKWKVDDNAGNWAKGNEFVPGNVAAGKYGDVSLTAQWTGHKIYYNLNNGKLNGSTTYGPDTFSESYKLPGAPERTGYNFAGWYVGSDKAGNAGGSWTPSRDELTLTAAWTPKNYTLTFDCDGGTPVQAAKNYTIEDSFNLPTSAGTKTGYAFSGKWKVTSADGSWTANSERSGYVSAGAYGSVTLKAVWNANTVTYNANGGSVSPSSASYPVSSLPTPTKSGSWFDGWYTAASGGTKYTKDTLNSALGSGNITAYAHWKGNITVTYNANGGSVSPSTATCSGTALTLPSATRTGYDFNGWYTAASGGTNVGSAGASYTPTAAITLYAQWTKNTYKITISEDSYSDLDVSYKDGSTWKSVSSNSTEVPVGSVVKVVVEYDKYKSFTISGVTKYYSNEGCTTSTTVSGDATVYFKMPASNVTVQSTGSSSTCFSADTLITLADGSVKAAKDVEPTDKLLSFNHFTGKYEPQDILVVVVSEEKFFHKCAVAFEDGTELEIINEHGLFDLTTMKYEMINLGNVEGFVGHDFVKYNAKTGKNESIRMTSWEDRYEKDVKYAFLTCRNINVIGNDLLTMCDEIEGLYNLFEYDDDLRYNEADMQRKIAKYGISDYSEWSDYFTYDQYLAFLLDYSNIAEGIGLTTKEQHLATFLKYYNCVVK